MTTSQQKEKRVSLLMDSGAMDDKNWKKEEVKHRMKQYIKLWEKMQKDMTYTTSPVSYVELKEQKVGRRKEVVEGVKEERDINMFMVINSYDNHHVIIDECSEILGYRYHIKLEYLQTLEETTEALSPTKVNTSNRGNYPMCHYSVWRDYNAIPYASADYRRELPASKEWCDKNKKLFDYLSDGLRNISPMTYVRYKGAEPYLQAHHNLHPLCGV